MKKELINVAMKCECGCGFECDNDTVIVETMPPHLRASHEAAGNRGQYPCNGAVRLRVSEACADAMIENDSDWTRIVEDKN